MKKQDFWRKSSRKWEQNHKQTTQQGIAEAAALLSRPAAPDSARLKTSQDLVKAFQARLVQFAREKLIWSF
jgi:hypothetical protein